MKKLFVLGLWVMSIVIITGCGASMQGVPTSNAMHAEGNFDGIYYSPAYGRLEMTANGDSIFGLYEGERHYGRLEGTIKDDLLKFTWTQWKTDLNGKVRKKTGKGYFKYVVKEEGTTKKRLVHWLEGEWGYDNNYTGNPWECVKLPKKAQKFLKPHENNGPTTTMDSDYAEAAGFGALDQSEGDSTESTSSSAPVEEEDQDQGGTNLDDLF